MVSFPFKELVMLAYMLVGAAAFVLGIVVFFMVLKYLGIFTAVVFVFYLFDVSNNILSLLREGNLEEALRYEDALGKQYDALRDIVVEFCS
mgnify:CR=1 FL=1